MQWVLWCPQLTSRRKFPGGVTGRENPAESGDLCEWRRQSWISLEKPRVLQFSGRASLSYRTTPRVLTQKCNWSPFPQRKRRRRRMKRNRGSNSQKLFKFDENYILTHPRSSTSPEQLKHEENYVETCQNHTAQNQWKRDILKSRQRKEIHYYHVQRNKDKNDSRLPLRNDASQKTAQQHL